MGDTHGQQVPLGAPAGVPTRRLRRGVYITFEGPEGGGKSTQIALLARRLEADGYPVLVTKQPGGTDAGRMIRHVLLHRDSQGKVLPKTESLLYWADRYQNHEEIVRPAIANGWIVIGDRDFDSSWAYQHAGRGIDADWLATVQRLVMEDFRPDRTVLIDGPITDLILRSLAKNKQVVAEHGDAADESRFEQEAADFHARLRAHYLERAAREPERFIVFDAMQTMLDLHAQVLAAVRDIVSTLEDA